MDTERTISLERTLTSLLQKYGVAPLHDRFRLTAMPDRDYDTCWLLPGWEFLEQTIGEKDMPLMPWRSRRSFIELRNLVINQTVEHISLMRFCFFTDPSWTLDALLYRELDLLEFISGSRVVAVHAVLDVAQGGNVIAMLANGVLGNIELNNRLSRPHHIDRHEIICERGVASDMVVDTQIPQSSVYLFNKDSRLEFTDYDAELFGFEKEEIDLIRAAYNVMGREALRDEYRGQHRHLTNLVTQVRTSALERRKINIDDNLIYETIAVPLKSEIVL